MSLLKQIKNFGKPSIVFFLGGPGTGKGTQCEKLKIKYGFNHLSAGELLRIERSRGTDIGEMIEDCLINGRIVPSEITINLLKLALTQNTLNLIDGFPRNEENMYSWENSMKNQINFLGVVNIFCDEQIMTQRILERAKISGRSDDNEESLKKRFKTFRESTQKVLEFYQLQNKLQNVDGDGTLDQVSERVEKALETLIEQK